jgi:hypothetical protein
MRRRGRIMVKELEMHVRNRLNSDMEDHKCLAQRGTDFTLQTAGATRIRE